MGAHSARQYTHRTRGEEWSTDFAILNQRIDFLNVSEFLLEISKASVDILQVIKESHKIVDLPNHAVH